MGGSLPHRAFSATILFVSGDSARARTGASAWLVAHGAPQVSAVRVRMRLGGAELQPGVEQGLNDLGHRPLERVARIRIDEVLHPVEGARQGKRGTREPDIGTDTMCERYRRARPAGGLLELPVRAEHRRHGMKLTEYDAPGWLQDRRYPLDATPEIGQPDERTIRATGECEARGAGRSLGQPGVDLGAVNGQAEGM